MCHYCEFMNIITSSNECHVDFTEKLRLSYRLMFPHPSNVWSLKPVNGPFAVIRWIYYSARHYS